MKVVNLGEARDLLRRWDEVRTKILNGEVTAFALCVKDDQGREAIFYAGQYERRKAEGLKASMAMSWQLNQAAEFRNSV